MAPLPSWTPDLATLDLLISVAELGSLGRAAAAHQISQPSASARLARLERQVGSALLTRGVRGSTLTLTGETVVAWARPVVESARLLSDGVAALRTDRGARLRVAASLTIAEYLMPDWLMLFRRNHPDVETAVQVTNSHNVAEAVRTGSADVGFVESPDPPSDLNVLQIGMDRVTLVVAADDPLCREANRHLRASEVLVQPLLLREPGSGTRDTFLSALGIHRLAPSRIIELGSTATIVATTLAGGGIGVVSARAVVREIASKRLVELHIADVILERPLHAIWVGTRPPALATELITIAREIDATPGAGQVK